jgi:16S rRNA (adenine1518-N6/adenine1519-N6)-dimethyltransferase
VSLVANVPPNCFFPRPDVHSAVVKINVARRGDIDRGAFFPIIKAAFASRRKTLLNCLAAAPELGLTKEAAAKLISAAGLPESVRGEALAFEDFARLALCLPLH